MLSQVLVMTELTARLEMIQCGVAVWVSDVKFCLDKKANQRMLFDKCFFKHVESSGYIVQLEILF